MQVSEIESFEPERTSQEEEKGENHVLNVIESEEIMEFEIIRKMRSQYMRMIEFNAETGNIEQIEKARKELQVVLEAYNKMKYYRLLDFRNCENNEIIKECSKNYT